MIIYGNVLEQDIKINSEVAVALGKFDGLHRGHRTLIEQLSLAKSQRGLLCVVFAFVKSPKETLEGEDMKYILTTAEKRLFMEQNGVDILVECPIKKEILSMEPEDFIEKILKDKLNVKEIICGSDFRFGHNRRGNVEFLREHEHIYNYRTIIVDKLKYDERDISSTYIREEIAKGNISLVNELLGYPYTVMGVVRHGKQLGRTIGFPTVNIVSEADKMLPPNGVYLTVAVIDGKEYPAITNIGTRPTVDNSGNTTIETHLFDVSIDMYGRPLELRFLRFIRPEKKFENIDKLKEAIRDDIRVCRDAIKDYF